MPCHIMSALFASYQLIWCCVASSHVMSRHSHHHHHHHHHHDHHHHHHHHHQRQQQPPRLCTNFRQALLLLPSQCCCCCRRGCCCRCCCGCEDHDSKSKFLFAREKESMPPKPSRPDPGTSAKTVLRRLLENHTACPPIPGYGHICRLYRREELNKLFTTRLAQSSVYCPFLVEHRAKELNTMQLEGTSTLLQDRSERTEASMKYDQLSYWLRRSLQDLR